MPACMHAMLGAGCGESRRDACMSGPCLQGSSSASLCGLALALGLGGLEGLGSAPALEAPVAHHLSNSHLPQRGSGLNVSLKDTSKAWQTSLRGPGTERASANSSCPTCCRKLHMSMADRRSACTVSRMHHEEKHDACLATHHARDSAVLVHAGCSSPHDEPLKSQQLPGRTWCCCCDGVQPL